MLSTSRVWEFRYGINNKLLNYGLMVNPRIDSVVATYSVRRLY